MAAYGIHAVCTGTAAVSTPFLTRKGNAVTSKLRILATQKFAHELPILCWLIEHDEGDILVDAGMGEATVNPAYANQLSRLVSWLPLNFCHFTVRPGEGLGAQLDRIRPQGRSGLRVVLTHLHSDHVSGLADLELYESQLNQAEWQDPYGVSKQLLSQMRPQRVSLKSDATLPFGGSFPLTRAGDVLLVATPGHTRHHCSVILRRGGLAFFFAGDMVYTQDQLLQGTIAGPHASPRMAMDSIHHVRSFASKEPCVFLPSHDPESERRLEAIDILRA